MSVEQTIITTLTPIVSTVVPDIYQGNAKEFITFNYSEYQQYAESTSYAITYSVQVHYFAPLKTNVLTKKNQIAVALNGAGFTFPSIINANDKDGQHYVYECIFVGGRNGTN